MTSAGSADPGRPEALKAVPVRHPGRWVGIGVIAVLAAMFVHLLVTSEAFQWSFMVDNAFSEPIREGARTTIYLTVLSMLLGVALGVLLAVMRLSPNKILSWTAWAYVWFFRSVPRLVLLVLCGNLGIIFAGGRVELGLPFDRQILDLFGMSGDARFFGFDSFEVISGFRAALLGLMLSEAAYMAEIVRAGILSVDSGQSEAAAALGMSRPLALRRIVLPQAMRVVLPPTGNETIAMLKDTSLVIAVPVTNELFFQLQAVGNRSFQVFPLLVAACLWYVALTSVLMVGQYFLEKRFSRGVAGQIRQKAAGKVPVGGMGGAQ